MRICRYRQNGDIQTGFYYDTIVVPVSEAAARFAEAAAGLDSQAVNDPLALTGPGDAAGPAHQLARRIEEDNGARDALAVQTADVELLAPVASPPKIILLAGNYASHIEEEGQIAVERAETFPYLFSKPITALNHPNAPIPIPRVSPDHIDYECELGVVIGQRVKHASEADALRCVAGYTVVNDISDRKYQPFPDRRPRERDAFFDWLVGKWHDGSCPTGPCLRSARSLPDPQQQRVTTHVNGELRQDARTDQMIFPVAAVIAFITRTITLEPGDIIATGTPAGVGMATGSFLKEGDRIDAAIEGIGVLSNVMINETGS